jgi:hypothetical protein
LKTSSFIVVPCCHSVPEPSTRAVVVFATVGTA